VWLAAVVMASGLLVAALSVAGWQSAEATLPPVIAVVLMAGAVWGRRRGLAPALSVLAASTFGFWVITLALGAASATIGGWPLAVQMLLVNGAKLVPLALVVAALAASRLGAARADLRVGSWRAETGLRVRGRPVDWRWVGGAAAIVLVGAIAASGAASFSAAGLRTAAVWLPVYGFAAVVNSAAEEIIFRHAVNAATRALLAPLTRVALTSTYFGLAHIHGTPSGVPGVLLAGALGVVLALAIEHTRGFCWNWTLHFLADLSIFAILIATAVN
jgi:membrane protease YdiL (CAAX protease family)